MQQSNRREKKTKNSTICTIYNNQCKKFQNEHDARLKSSNNKTMKFNEFVIQSKASASAISVPARANPFSIRLNIKWLVTDQNTAKP